VVLQLEAARLGDAALALLDLGIEELLDPAAIEADQMIEYPVTPELSTEVRPFTERQQKIHTK